MQAVMHAKTSGRFSTGEYRAMTKTSESTALRELRQLTKLRVLEKVGGSGRAAHYVVVKAKPPINPSNPSEIDDRETRHKGDIVRTTAYRMSRKSHPKVPVS